MATQIPDRAAAIKAAADAVNAHASTPGAATFHNMNKAVQTAQNLGASLTDIRDAR